MSVPIGTRLSALALALVGIGLAILAAMTGLGTLSSPGAGMWPLLTAVILVAAAAVSSRDSSAVDAESAGWKRALLGSASLAAFLVLFYFLGLIIPAVLVVFFWLKVLSGEPTKISAIVAVVMAASAYVIFVVLLGVPIRDVVASIWGG